MQLVNALVEQIEGSINLERGKGTRFIIKFKGEIQDSNEKDADDKDWRESRKAEKKEEFNAVLDKIIHPV